MKKQILNSFCQLGKLLEHISTQKLWSGFETGVTEIEYNQLTAIINKQFIYNGWFTKENVLKSLKAWSSILTKEQLEEWSNSYDFAKEPKKVAVIMAGNIPLVGFHDFLCILMSGHAIVAKMSSDDNTLLPALVDVLIKWEPGLTDRISLHQQRLGKFDAVIATGSNNSMQHFEEYFAKYPHLFRRNRTSMAVLDGSESESDLKNLGEDIFSYFGLGCRNVTHLMVPDDFELSRFFEGIYSFSEVIYNKKYGNNYDYNKAVYLMNKLELLDNNFVLLRNSEELFSPIGMIHYHRYQSKNEIEKYIELQKENLQVIVGKNYFEFGQAQKPGLADYADHIDTMTWLNNL